MLLVDGVVPGRSERFAGLDVSAIDAIGEDSDGVITEVEITLYDGRAVGARISVETLEQLIEMLGRLRDEENGAKTAAQGPAISSVEQDPSLNVPEDLKTCPMCAETIKKAAIVCKHCGRDVQPEAASLSSTPRPAQTRPSSSSTSRPGSSPQPAQVSSGPSVFKMALAIVTAHLALIVGSIVILAIVVIVIVGIGASQPSEQQAICDTERSIVETGIRAFNYAQQDGAGSSGETIEDYLGGVPLEYFSAPTPDGANRIRTDVVSSDDCPSVQAD